MNTSELYHKSLLQDENRQLIYTAMSKRCFYLRMHISKYVLQKGNVPLNPFMLFDYFLLDCVNRNIIRDANNSIVLRADQLWVFGPISNGVAAEIALAKKANKPISYFAIENPSKTTVLNGTSNIKIISISENEVEMEIEQ